MFLVTQHWVAPAISIKVGLSWSRPSLFQLTSLFFFGFFQFSDNEIVTYDVNCDFVSCDLCIFVFWGQINIS